MLTKQKIKSLITSSNDNYLVPVLINVLSIFCIVELIVINLLLQTKFIYEFLEITLSQLLIALKDKNKFLAECFEAQNH